MDDGVRALLPASRPKPGAHVPPAIGGVPDVVGALTWPSCRVCGHPMRFLFQLELDPATAIYAFHCENPDTVCPAWDPADGANAVVRVRASGAGEILGARDGRAYPRTFLADEPAEEDTAALSIDENEADDAALQDLDDAREAAPPSKLGGVPVWVQGPDRLECCGEPMRFVAQIDAAPFGLYLGDAGRAYVFACENGAELRMLVQSA